MQEAGAFLDDLAALGVRDYFGVPDSLLSGLISGVDARAGQGGVRLEITADEGAAVALGIGHHLGTGGLSAVFMQNSGLGNAVNPLTSLTSPKVYGIPMLLLVGWRGEMTAEGQLKDEPQHVFQGEITCEMLKLLDIPHRVVGPGDSRDAIRAAARALVETARSEARPTALVIRKNAFSGPAKSARKGSDYPAREAAIEAALACLGDVPVVGTTGKISREIYEVQRAKPIGGPAFLSVGGMGHAVMIATGLAMTDPRRKVACFDGDGAVLMHAGSLANSSRQPNLIHLVFNNQVHDSVGGQVTAGPDARLSDLALSLGYRSALRVTNLTDLKTALDAAMALDCASFVEIMVAPGARPDLGRPRETPASSKSSFMTTMRHADD